MFVICFKYQQEVYPLLVVQQNAFGLRSQFLSSFYLVFASLEICL